MTEQEFLTSEDPAAMVAHVAGRHGSHLHGARPRLASDRRLRLFACAAARLDPLWPTWHEASPSKVSVFRVEECVEAGQPNHNFDDRGTRDRGFFWAVCRSEDAARMAADGPERRALAALLREIVGDPFRPVTISLPVTSPPWPRSQVRKTDAGLWRVIPDWLTPQVLSLAQAAYDERPGRKCGKCKGSGWVWGANQAMRSSGEYRCDTCNGTGTIDDGTLDPFRLLVLADALEEAGCPDPILLNHLRGFDPCPNCNVIGAFTVEQKKCGPRVSKCDSCSWNTKGWRPAGPHVRGCWAIDLILGKE